MGGVKNDTFFACALCEWPLILKIEDSKRHETVSEMIFVRSSVAKPQLVVHSHMAPYCGA